MSPEAPTSLGARRLLRSAGLGLCGGLFIGGLMLLFLGSRGLLAPPDCSRLSKLECELALKTALEVGRVQLVCGGALVALALSVLVLLRPVLRGNPPGEP
ncbi:hypothetical protein P2318_06800 [Myxococcaceae bacterium GXIMD 01537]